MEPPNSQWIFPHQLIIKPTLRCHVACLQQYDLNNSRLILFSQATLDRVKLTVKAYIPHSNWASYLRSPLSRLYSTGITKAYYHIELKGHLSVVQVHLNKPVRNEDKIF